MQCYCSICASTPVKNKVSDTDLMQQHIMNLTRENQGLHHQVADLRAGYEKKDCEARDLRAVRDMKESQILAGRIMNDNLRIDIENAHNEISKLRELSHHYRTEMIASTKESLAIWYALDSVKKFAIKVVDDLHKQYEENPDG